MKNFLSKLWGLLLKVYDNMTSTEVKVSIGDIILKSPNPDFILFIFASRFLDAKNYCNAVDTSFKYMNGISYKAHGELHSPTYGIERFKELIDSFQQNGYDQSSLLVLDKDFNLRNGTHRLALCLLNGIYTVNAQIIRRKSLSRRTVDWFYGVGLESNFLADIQDEYDSIYKELIVRGQAFVCRVEGDVKSVIDDLKRDLKGLSGSPIVNIISETDSIVEYSFAVVNPRYRVCRDIEGGVISQRIIEIESLLIKRYKDKVTVSISKNCIH